MKKMNSGIALICALVMMVQSFVCVSFAQENIAEVTSQPLTTSEYALFNALGMISEEMSFNEGQPIKRSEYAYIMAYMLGYKGEKYEDYAPFADVDADAYYAGAVSFLAKRGIIFGDSNGFRPNDSIVYDEATVMAIRALGYYEYAKQKYGEYPENIRLMAAYLNLYDGIEGFNYTDYVKAEDAFVFLKNVSETLVLSSTTIGGDYVEYENLDGETLLKTYCDISFDTAKMIDNGVTALDSASNLGKGFVKIGDKQLKVKENLYNAEEMIGEVVDIWYYNNAEELLYIQRNTQETDILEIPYDNLKVNDSKYSMTNIVYYTQSNKIKEAKLSVAADMIYNGAAYPYFTLDDLKISSGTLMLVDDNNDKVYDTVKVTQYIDCIVKSVIPSENQIVAADTSVIFDEWESYRIIDKNGNPADITAITANSPVAIAMSHGSDKTYVKVVDLSSKTITGMLSATSIDGAEHKWLVNDTEYALSSGLVAKLEAGTKQEPNSGDNYKYNVNMDGNIFNFEKNLAADEWYDGYIIAIGEEKEISSKKLIARIIMTDKTAIDVYFKDKFNLNGSNISAADASTDERLFRYSGSKKLTKRQPIRFKLNDWEEISSFETPKDITKEEYEYDLEVFSLDKSFATVQYKPENVKAVNGIYLLTGDTMVIQDPYLSAAEDVTDPKRVLYLSRDDLGATDGLVNAQLYDMDEYMCVGTLVFESFPGANGTTFDEAMCVIDRAYMALNSDEEPVYMIDCGAYGAYRTYEAYDNSVSFAGLNQGDVIKVKFRDSKIYEWKLLCSLSEPQEAKYVYNPEGIVNTLQSIIYGSLVTVNTTGFVMVGPDEPETDGGNVLKLIGNSFNNNNTRVVVYDTRAKTVKAGSPASMYANVVPDAQGNLIIEDTTTRVLVRRRWGYAAEVVFVIH